MSALGAFLLASCLAVNPASDQVTAGDLAPSFPGLDTVDAGTPLAMAPALGASRVFRVPELTRLAERFHLAPPGSAICVERKAAPLDLKQALAAMQAALPAAEISILDWSRTPVPDGEITFPPSQLRNGATGQWWNGSVRYGGVHQFSIWARVSVHQTADRIVALRDLPPGEEIAADAIAIQHRETIPGARDFAVSLDQVAGKWTRALIHSGAPVRLSELARPLDVRRGDKVQVDAQNGAAHLTFEAQAEGSGATGDRIPLTNPESHRRFTGRIVGKGRVSVDSSVGPEKP
ncbi:MAG TPA: flagellar basal body P-ring formation chaperone FlgA [Bryobacteraceae bacterium]|nr:flagellar basal body P-ring formation chaperone FlgA [Bryobacteraceae bacterium]